MERALEGLPSVELIDGISVRVMRGDEESAVLAALNRAWETTEGFRPIRPHQLAADLQDGSAGFLVAIDDASEAIVGTAHAMLDPEARLPDGGWRGWVSNVTTDPAYRGRGIGRLMLTEALSLLRERGATMARLGVAEASGGAIGLYESMGFEAVGRSAWYLRPL
jgi:ribosomal protein S18 acetylase RimI-like enzyme